MIDNPDDPVTTAFLLAVDNIRDSIKGLTEWDAGLALTICLAECIVFGNSENDAPNEASRLAQTIRVLGDITLNMIIGDDNCKEDGDEDPRLAAPSPDLLRKLLERRRATKPGS